MIPQQLDDMVGWSQLQPRRAGHGVEVARSGALRLASLLQRLSKIVAHLSELSRHTDEGLPGCDGVALEAQVRAMVPDLARESEDTWRDMLLRVAMQVESLGA